MPGGEPGRMGILGIDGAIIHSLCRIKYCRTCNSSCPGLPEVGRYSYSTSQGVGVVSRLVPSCWELKPTNLRLKATASIMDNNSPFAFTHRIFHQKNGSKAAATKSFLYPVTICKYTASMLTSGLSTARNLCW